MKTPARKQATAAADERNHHQTSALTSSETITCFDGCITPDNLSGHLPRCKCVDCLNRPESPEFGLDRAVGCDTIYLWHMFCSTD